MVNLNFTYTLINETPTIDRLYSSDVDIVSNLCVGNTWYQVGMSVAVIVVLLIKLYLGRMAARPRAPLWVRKTQAMADNMIDMLLIQLCVVNILVALWRFFF